MKKIILLAFVLVLLITVAMTFIGPIQAQDRTVGVSEGDWFEYTTYVTWESNDPESQPPWWLIDTGEIELFVVVVKAISGTSINVRLEVHYRNGSVESDTTTWDINGGGMIYAANLSQGDILYPSSEDPVVWINETIPFTYEDSVRDVNHINASITFWREDLEYPNTSANIYFDKATGVMVKAIFDWHYTNQTSGYTTTWLYKWEIVDTNLWVIPEFPIGTSMLLILIALTVAIAIYKRRLSKTYR